MEKTEDHFDLHGWDEGLITGIRLCTPEEVMVWSGKMGDQRWGESQSWRTTMVDTLELAENLRSQVRSVTERGSLWRVLWETVDPG